MCSSVSSGRVLHHTRKLLSVLTGLLSSRTTAALSSCGWFSRSNATGTANHAHAVPQQLRLSQETSLFRNLCSQEGYVSIRS